ncbi:hypothetical protein EYF80_037818 [Liparis tanakae]|uniref:Uncharacterized protein n=1 Tax=Liparis tanakae TaxID=230148 RepID=A0A4Z2GEI7_9TELE|nr:hypothetical protein EYF80_037818 [Liparis tanakae]
MAGVQGLELLPEPSLGCIWLGRAAASSSLASSLRGLAAVLRIESMTLSRRGGSGGSGGGGSGGGGSRAPAVSSELLDARHRLLPLPLPLSLPVPMVVLQRQQLGLVLGQRALGPPARRRRLLMLRQGPRLGSRLGGGGRRLAGRGGARQRLQHAFTEAGCEALLLLEDGDEQEASERSGAGEPQICKRRFSPDEAETKSVCGQPGTDHRRGD